MKNYLLSFIFVLFFCDATSQTNVYHPFPDSSANWNFTVQNVCWGILGNSLYQHQMSIELGPDTIINLTTYHSLHIPAYIVNAGPNCFNPPPGNYILPGKYVGAIRNDHIAKRTYIIPEQSSIEQLLYDFNWQVGDTITGYLDSPIAAFEDTVISIDSVLVGSSYRKRWFIDPYYQVYLIEGIGSTYGLINPIPAGISDNDDYVLNCYNQDNVPLYPSGSSGCPVLTDIEDLAEHEVQLVVYPNPAKHSITLKLPLTYSLHSGVVEVTTVEGKQLSMRTILTDENASIQLPLQGFSSGVYFIRISIGKQLYTIRFNIVE